MAPNHKRHDLTLSNGTKISILEGVGSIYLMMSEVNVKKGKVGSKVFAQITPWRVGLHPDGLTPEEWSRLMQPKGSLGLMPTASHTCSLCYVVFPCSSSNKAFYNTKKEDSGTVCSVCNRIVCDACIESSYLSAYPKPAVVCNLCYESSKHEFARTAESVDATKSACDESAKTEDTTIAEQIEAVEAHANKVHK